MPRKLRVEYEGAIYHLMNRGDRREPIFVDDEDRKMFLKTLGEALGRGVKGVRRTEGGAIGGGDVAGGGMGARGVKATAEGGREQSADGGAAARENHDDVAMDC